MKKNRRCNYDRISDSELERLGLQRIWGAVLLLPLPEGGDDFEPTPDFQAYDRFEG